MIGGVNTGGGAKAFAYIVVTYPAGSLCTCSCGTKVLKARGTDGEYIFAVPFAGTWSVMATDGTKIKTKNVVVSNENEIIVKGIKYELILYDSITGWNTEFANFITKNNKRWPGATGNTGAPSVSYSSGIMTVKSSGTNYSGGTFSNTIPIDLTDYDELFFIGTSQADRDAYTYFGVFSQVPNYSSGENVLALISHEDDATLYENEVLDISNISTLGYVSINPARNTREARFILSRVGLR